jgi:hypothetical protein
MWVKSQEKSDFWHGVFTPILIVTYGTLIRNLGKKEAVLSHLGWELEVVEVDVNIGITLLSERRTHPCR